MKVLVIHNKYKQYGGEDKAVDDLFSLLKSKGIDTYAYQKDNKELDNYTTLNKFNLIKSGFYSQRTIQELRKIISDFKPDIAHIHNIYPLISPVVYKILYDNKIKIVQTLHNYRFLCPNGLFYTNNTICTVCLEENSFKSCIRNKCYRNSYVQSLWYSLIIQNGYKRKYFDKIDRFIVFNTKSKEFIVKKGFEENKVEIIPNYTDVTEKVDFDLYKQNYMVFIGRLSSEKGIYTLLDTMKNIKETKLKIIGSGPLKDDITDRIKKENLNNVELLGFKTGREKIDLIKNAKALIFPSEWYETFGLTIIEAFSLGTTVIASDIGGISDIVKNNDNGLLFETKNPLDLERKIKYILQDKEELKRLSYNSYNTYLEKYSASVFYSNIINLYESLLN